MDTHTHTSCSIHCEKHNFKKEEKKPDPNYFQFQTFVYILMCKVGTSQSLIKRYLTNVPPDGRVWHKAYFSVVPGTGPWPRHARQLQKCFGSRQHSPN